MELRVLRYFVEVARRQNITAAAEALHITQPTLSKQLMDLEDELGKRLFDRGRRRIALTEAGVFLLRRAQEIIELTDRTEAALRATDEALTGDISVGCGETEGMRLVIRAMQRVHERHPDITFHLYSGNDEDVSERLNSGLIDFGLFVGDTALAEYDYIKLPVRDTWGLLMRSDCALAAAPSIRPQDIVSVPLLCSRQALASNELSGWLGSDFSRLNILSTHNLIHNAALMVEEGMGCALTIDRLVNTNGTALVFRPLEPTVNADLFFARRKYHTLSKASEVFLAVLQELIAKEQ